MKTLILLICMTLAGFSQSVWFLDADSPAAQGNQNGMTLATAFDSLTAEVFDSLGAGDVLWVYGGTYPVAAQITLPATISGNSASDPTEIRAAEPGAVIQWTSQALFSPAAALSYIQFRGIILDCQYSSSGNGFVFVGTTYTHSNIDFIGCTLAGINSHELILGHKITNSDLYRCYLFENTFSAVSSSSLDVTFCTLVGQGNISVGFGKSVRTFKNNVVLFSTANFDWSASFAVATDVTYNTFNSDNATYYPTTYADGNSWAATAASMVISATLGTAYDDYNYEIKPGSLLINTASNNRDRGAYPFVGLKLNLGN